MTTVKETIEAIQKQAKENQERPRELKVKQVPDLKPGECYRQGDLYIFKVANNHLVGEEIKNERQLAEGSSIGARHVLLGDFKLYKGIQEPIKTNDGFANLRTGHAFDVTGECTNAHPEHDHFKFSKDQCGRYQVMHQMDLRTLQRAAD